MKLRITELREFPKPSHPVYPGLPLAPSGEAQNPLICSRLSVPLTQFFPPWSAAQAPSKILPLLVLSSSPHLILKTSLNLKGQVNTQPLQPKPICRQHTKISIRGADQLRNTHLLLNTSQVKLNFHFIVLKLKFFFFSFK